MDLDFLFRASVMRFRIKRSAFVMLEFISEIRCLWLYVVALIVCLIVAASSCLSFFIPRQMVAWGFDLN